MFSALQRGQHVLNFSLTVAGFIAAFIIASSWYQLYADEAFLTPGVLSNISPTANVKFSRRFGSSNSKGKENSKIVFDLQSDLTPLFNWNTKQVFVYLTAEYPGKSQNSSNKITYWDKIITSKERANLSLQNERSKYSVWDIEESFRNRDAVLNLEWNIQPYVGPLVFGKIKTANTQFSFPFTEEPNKKERAKRKVQ